MVESVNKIFLKSPLIYIFNIYSEADEWCNVKCLLLTKSTELSASVSS